MKNIKRISISLLTIIFLFFMQYSGRKANAVSGETDLYPVQQINLSIFDSTRLLRATEDALLRAEFSDGKESQNWHLRYIERGVYEIVNGSTEYVLTQREEEAVVDAAIGSNLQRWNIIGVDRDFLGNDLYYKIVNVSTGKALTFERGGNRILLTDYNATGSQKWKINCRGLEGFAANCSTQEGEKAANIGGLFGETIFVSTADQLKASLARTEPLTIVLTENVDCSGENYDWMIEDNKTLIGSYAANQMRDCKLRTNDYFGVKDPSDNIIIKNISFQIEVNKNMMAIAVYSSKNIWVDHCTFDCAFTKEKAEVGKFIWINTPYDGKDVGRSPDFITLSYNVFRNRYWTVAFGTQNGETSKNRASMMYNVWDSCVRRCPQIGNGTLHTYNNYHVRNTTSVDNAGLCQIICGAGSVVCSESNRFEKMQKESSGYWDVEVEIDRNAEFSDSGSYTDKTEHGGGVSYPFVMSGGYTKTQWNPGEHYGYTLLPAYQAGGTGDAKEFCMEDSGARTLTQGIHYITDADKSQLAVKQIACPFLMAKEEDLITEPEHIHSPATEWSQDAAGHWHVCSSCEGIVNDAAHTASEWILAVLESGTTGTRFKKCTVCGYLLETEEIAPTEQPDDPAGTGHVHTASGWIVQTAATKEKTGTQYKKCSICGYILETKVIPQLKKTQKSKVLKKVSSVKVRRKNSKKAVILWKQQKKADGYQIVYGIGKTFHHTKRKRVVGKQATIKKLKRKKVYYVKVRAYCKVGGKRVYGPYSGKKKFRFD